MTVFGRASGANWGLERRIPHALSRVSDLDRCFLALRVLFRHFERADLLR